MPPSTTLTRGPLPPGTYWRRRIILLVGAAALVFVIAQLLGGGSNGKGGEPVAQQAGATFVTTPATTTGTGTAGVGPTNPLPTAATDHTTAALTLAAPTGPCSPGDITVTPTVAKAVAGSDVTIDLALQTKTSPACTWQVGPSDLAVKIVRMGNVLWTSQQCPSAIPARPVVVRSAVPSVVTMVWNARVSTVGCRAGSDFVNPGRLNIYASTLGGEPGYSGFSLVVPGAQQTSATSTATAHGTATARATTTARATATATATATRPPRR